MVHTDSQRTAPNNQVSEAERRRRIRELNDIFRRQQTPAAFMLGEFVKAPLVREMPWGDQWAVVEMVKRFERFDDEGEPNGLHDYGAFTYKDQRFFWKIDYVDPKLTKLSDDASDPERAVRFLTIHMTEEPRQ